MSRAYRENFSGQRVGRRQSGVEIAIAKAMHPGRNVLRAACTLKRGVLRFAAEESGTTFLEFALVAPVFFFLLFGIFEVAIVMFTQTHLQGATQLAARQVRTGYVQASADPITTFRGLFCDQLVTLIKCDARLITDVRSTDNFSEITFPNFYTATGQPDGNVFDPGDPNQTVVVRSVYTWKIMTPLLEPFLANNGSGGRIITATVIVKNEPFGAALQ